MLHGLLFTAALGAALLVPATASAQSRAQDASPPAQKRAAPAVRASAQKLQNDARRLDAKAAGLERASVAKRDRALEGRASAEALEARARRARGTARARLEARADDARTSAAIDEATADAKASEAAVFRAEAKALRAQARRRAKAKPVQRRHTSSLALSSHEPCRVTIDGASYGYTPHARVRLAPGTHDVSCETLSGVTLRHRVVTRAGTIRRLHFDTASRRTAAVVDPFH